MNNSFGQSLTTEERLQLGKLRADTPGPQTHYRSYQQAHNTTTNDASNHAFMHSGFPRKAPLPPLPDKSPRPRAPTQAPTMFAPPTSAPPTQHRASYCSTPGYMAPGQTSARAYPRETAEVIAMPAHTMADLAMFVAGAYPHPTATSSFSNPGDLLTPQRNSRDTHQQRKWQVMGGERTGFSGGEAGVRGYHSQRQAEGGERARDEAEVREFGAQVRKRNEAVGYVGTGDWSEKRSAASIEEWLSRIP